MTRQADRQTDIETIIQSDGLTYRQTGRHTDSRRDRQKDVLTDRQSDKIHNQKERQPG